MSNLRIVIENLESHCKLKVINETYVHFYKHDTIFNSGMSR